MPDSDNSSDRLVLGALAAFAGAVTTVWAGAVVAAVVTGHGLPHAITLSDAAQAAVHLPSHASSPALAWPPAVARTLPGPVIYWMATVAVVVAVGAIVTVAVRFWRRSNVRGRVRLGLDTRARFATLKDLGPLLVTAPIPAGRLVLGRVHGKLVATEDARGAPVSTRKAGGRQGDRGSVAMIGPARSGKTANTASAIRDWTGPAVIVSVRRDLMDATIEPRQACGKIAVFDPAGITGTSSPSRWSPLRSTSTPAGAQKAAASLAAAIPRSGVEGGTDYWVAQAEILLTGLLAVGSLADDVTMNDVARWVFTTDMPSPGGPPSHVLGIIQKAGLSTEAAVRDHATWAIEHLNAVWRLDERVRSSIYATVQTVVKPWMDPAVAASAEPTKAGFVDLDWLDGGANTLYLVAPLADQARFAPVLGGLLGDLKDQAYSWEVSGRQLRSPLLVVIDEAGNMPLAWLPEVASTCSAIGILLVTIWQSKSQLDAAYGRLSDSVLTNHLTKIVFAGCSDESTLGYVSRLMGDEEVERRSTSFDVGGGGRRSVSESTQREALSPFHLLRQVRPGEAVLIHGTLPPAHMQARRWWEELPGGSRKSTTARRVVGRAVGQAVVALTTLRSDREG